MNFFRKHLEEQNMSYFQHLVPALGYASRLLVYSGVLVIHAFAPFVFEKYVSDRVKIK